MAKTQRTDLKRRADLLLDAAASLLLEKGPGRIHVGEVADRAGVGKGTVYLHWTSREQLLLAVGAREAAAMLHTVITAIRAEATEAAPHRYLRRHFLEAMRRPVLRAIFVTDDAELGALNRERAGLRATKPVVARDYLTVLGRHRLLRPGQDLDDVDYGLQAVAYGFFAAAPLLGDEPERTLHHRADQLAEVVRRSFEAEGPPSPQRFAAAAPHVIDAFTRLADEYRRTAYGAAAD